MKVLFSAFSGAVQVVEDQGVVSLKLDDKVALGGGEAAGVVKVEGQGCVQLDGELGLRLGEALLNAHLPASVLPLALVVEGVANQAVKALE